MMLIKTFEIPNDLAQLETLRLMLESLREPWSMDNKTVFDLNLALEEVISNIIFYGYDDDATHMVNIRIVKDNDTLKVQIKDDARPFNPLKAVPPDLTMDLNEREVGGLGIHFVRMLMDKVTYRRSGNKNILTLIKNMNPPAAPEP